MLILSWFLLPGISDYNFIQAGLFEKKLSPLSSKSNQQLHSMRTKRNHVSFETLRLFIKLSYLQQVTPRHRCNG